MVFQVPTRDPIELPLVTSLDDYSVTYELAGGYGKIARRLEGIDPDAERRWRTLFEFDGNRDRFEPYFVSQAEWDTGEFWAISNRNREHAAIVKVDLETGKEAVFYQHADKPIDSVVFSADNKRPLFANLRGVEPEYIAFDKRFETALDLSLIHI